MPDAAVASYDTDADALASPFAATLVRLVRAHDMFGALDRQPPERLLAEFVVSGESRCKPDGAEPADERVLWRIETFYGAVGMRIGELAGAVATPFVKLHHGCFGRVVLVAGRLVVVSQPLSDVQRFGFRSYARLAAEGEELAAAAAELVRRFPDLAGL